MASFAQNIRPLFRPKDVSSMKRYFDLSSYQDVKAHAQPIYEAVASGDMPCDEQWSDDQVALFKRWLDEGMPE